MVIRGKLPVSNDEMNRHRHRQDQHQRNKIGRNNGHLPAGHTQQSDHGDARIDTAGQRQKYPANRAKDNCQHYDQKH